MRHPQLKKTQVILKGFIALTLVLVLTVLFLTLPQATITLNPHIQDINTKFTIALTKNPDEVNLDEKTIYGEVFTRTVAAEAEGQGSEAITQIGTATGRLTVINNYSRSQPLVAGTRFLSAEGLLFRSTESVTVLPGTQAEVTVEADQPGGEYDVAPGKFTIPGLWEGIRDQIYGESRQTFSGGEIEAFLVRQQDIDKNEAALYEQLLSELNQQIETEFSGQFITTDINILRQETNTTPGQEVVSFTSSLELEAKIVTIPAGDDFLNLLFQALDETTTPQYDLYTMDESTINIEIQEEHEGLVDVLVSVSGQARAQLDQIDVGNFVNMTADDARAKIIEENPRIDDARVEIFPSFYPRVPLLDTRIKTQEKVME